MPSPRRSKPARTAPASDCNGQAAAGVRRISLALQGGGSHGAFTWGVLDRLLEDQTLEIEAISGTSAGAMNAAALAAGYTQGGREGARQALDRFWHSTSEQALFSPYQTSPLNQLMGHWNLDGSPLYQWMGMVGRMFSPYQLNPFDYQPLRDILARQIDLQALRSCTAIRVFVTATSVRTGRARVFGQENLSLDALLASACLPHLFRAVEIDGEPYWDGGYMGNPVIWPLIYGCGTNDVVLVQINPLEREGTPRTPFEIDDRMNEIAFNSSLIHEMRAISFVQRLLAEGALKEPHASRYRNMRMHMIADEDSMARLGATSKFNAERAFLEHLKQLGRDAAERWLAGPAIDVGQRSSLDIRERFLD